MQCGRRVGENQCHLLPYAVVAADYSEMLTPI
jgi:hypothetical protein